MASILLAFDFGGGLNCPSCHALCASRGRICYHVVNRGNARRDVFLLGGDYHAFLKALVDAGERVPMRVLAFCRMPNYFHLAVLPLGDRDLSRWMHRLLNARVRPYHRYHGGSGHLWQGRFKKHHDIPCRFMMSARVVPFDAWNRRSISSFVSKGSHGQIGSGVKRPSLGPASSTTSTASRTCSRRARIWTSTTNRLMARLPRAPRRPRLTAPRRG